MKKVTFLLATLLIGGMMLTGCKKEPQPTPTPEPTPTTVKVVYKLNNTNDTLTASNCFKYTFSYQGADGQMVTVNDVTLPWTSPEITVTPPFTAKIECQASYNEADLPASVVFGSVYSLLVNGSAWHTVNSFTTCTKEEFIQIVTDDPNYLKFSHSKTLVPN